MRGTHQQGKGMVPMRVEFINPFIVAAYEVLQWEVQARVSKGPVSIKKSSCTSRDVTVVIGVTGEVEGAVFYEMTEKTARNLASVMMGTNVVVFDTMAESAIAEMGNVITGRASAGLEAAGFRCLITPPTIIVGRGVVISTLDFSRLVVELETQYGGIEINVALREKIKGAAMPEFRLVELRRGRSRPGP